MHKIWHHLALAILFVALTVVAAPKMVAAASDASLAVTIPVQQNVPNASLTYQLTATSDNEAPLPPELPAGKMILSKTATQNLTLTFVRPGVYSYHLALVGEQHDLVRASQQFYDFDVWIFYNAEGQLTSQFIAKNAEGYKADGLLFRAVPPVPMTSGKTPATPTATGVRSPYAGTPITGKLPQTGDLVKSFSGLGLLFILIALLKLLLDRRENKNS